MNEERKKIVDKFQKWLDTKPSPSIIASECATISERYAQQRVNEVLDKAAEEAQMIMHDGHHKTNSYVKHVQVGANNVQIDKESILKLKSNGE